MGCISTGEKPKEEDNIRKSEELLNFHKVSLGKLDVVFRKYSKNGKLNPLQFTKAGEKLGIQIRNTDKCFKITKTFNKIRDEKGNYVLYDI